MPFASGTANTATQLLTAIDTLGLANGWTRIRGETDQNCISPKAARYWRFLWHENEDTNSDFRQLTNFEFRTTLGGPAITGTWFSKGVNTGAVPGPFRTADINDDLWWMYLDCGSPTIVREISLTCVIDNEAPRDFMVQWSNDALTWTTMFRSNGNPWADGETKIFQFDDGYLDPFHTFGTECRRTGANWTDYGSLSFTNNDADASDDRFVWQLPGYDANRRIYIEARGYSHIATSSNYIQWALSPEYDISNPDLGGQIGGQPGPIHIMDFAPVEYWIYLNSQRLIVITRSNADDYTSSYIGFMQAFAEPEEYPFPFLQSSTSSVFDAANATNNRLSSMCDAGDGAATFRRWDNQWLNIINRLSSAITNLYRGNPTRYMWPYHVGGADRGNWPFVTVGDDVDFDNHFLNQVEPTVQNELAIYPVIVVDEFFGNVGALNGVYCIPGGTVVPEQLVTLGVDNYRAFPNRDRRDGCNWFLVKEE